MALLAGLAFAGHASANGSATISWTAPGDGDLAGFRIYYKNSAFTCANWNGLSQDERRADNAAGAGATVVIPDSGHPLGATATKYVFTDTARLTPGSTYYFAVVAYDNASPANLSDCSVGSGTAGASKAVTIRLTLLLARAAVDIRIVSMAQTIVCCTRLMHQAWSRPAMRPISPRTLMLTVLTTVFCMLNTDSGFNYIFRIRGGGSVFQQRRDRQNT